MSKYTVTTKGINIDVYDVLKAFDVRNPAIQHAVKKLLKPGTRGHKDTLTDLNEAMQSIERAKELNAEDLKHQDLTEDFGFKTISVRT